MDITPTILSDQNVVQGYGPSGFRISGSVYESAVLVLPDEVVPLALEKEQLLTQEVLHPVLERGKKIEVLLCGLSPGQRPLPQTLKDKLAAHAISTDLMDTGAACRTYNVLLAEGRHVAALLVPQ